MCLGDLKRHNSEYTFSLPNLEGRTVATKNATTGKVEQFFDIKKKNGTELKFQILSKNVGKITEHYVGNCECSRRRENWR